MGVTDGTVRARYRMTAAAGGLELARTGRLTVIEDISGRRASPEKIKELNLLSEFGEQIIFEWFKSLTR